MGIAAIKRSLLFSGTLIPAIRIHYWEGRGDSEAELTRSLKRVFTRVKDKMHTAVLTAVGLPKTKHKEYSITLVNSHMRGVST
jgi:hypothetical protein